MPNSATIKPGLHNDSAFCRQLLMILSVCLFQFGCASLGPDFETPEAPVLENWTSDNPVISRDRIELSEWWTVFNDPVLNQLMEQSFRQNLPLQITGLRIPEARARLGIAEGYRYPQVQQIGGTASTNRISENSANAFPTRKRPGFNDQSIHPVPAFDYRVDLSGDDIKIRPGKGTLRFD